MSISEALEGKPIAVIDAPNDNRLQYRELARNEGINSILSVPMVLRGEVIGVMRVYTAEERHFSDDDIYFASAAAGLGAIALENAVLYKFGEHEYEVFRKKMLEWRASLDDGWVWPEIL